MANALWFPQANVRVEFHSVWTPESATSQFNVKGPIDLSQAQMTALYEYGNNWAANLLVYFGGRTIAGIRGYSTNAITDRNKTYVDTSTNSKQDYAKMARTLAHEIGHFICPTGGGHDGKATDLMFATNKSGGTQIRRARVRQVIR